MKMVSNGKLLLPVDPPKPPMVYSSHVQYDLIQDQLPRFIKAVIEAEGSIEGVVRQSSGIGRYTVLYRAFENMECEVYC